jgi:hypothetical protein
MSKVEEEGDFEFWLPQGWKLVPVLSSYNVKDSDLFTLLRQKGIYVGVRDRKQMIMLLASTLITPEDFQFLIKRISDREDKYRTTEANVPCYEDSDSIAEIITEGYVNALMENASDKYPMFGVKDVSYKELDKDKIEINGKVETHDWMRAVQATSKLHDFSFEVEKRGGMVYFISGTTTIETKRLIEFIREEVNRVLKSNGVVARKSKVFILRNEYFVDQVSMFNFFREFETKGYSILKFSKIIDIIFGIYEHAAIPSEFSWMKEKIEEVSLKGDNIESNDVIKLGQNGCLKFGEIESEFKFDLNGVKGTCIIKYGFPSGHRKTKKGNIKSVEFEAKVVSVNTLDANAKSDLIKKSIVADFNARKGIICSGMAKTGSLKMWNEVQGEIV